VWLQEERHSPQGTRRHTWRLTIARRSVLFSFRNSLKPL